MESHTQSVLNDVLRERERQRQLWGERELDHSELEWVSILSMELGKVSRIYWRHDPEEYRDELIHLAAVAVAAVERFDYGFSYRPS